MSQASASPGTDELSQSANLPASDPAQYRGGKTIQHWNPEDQELWQAEGNRVATRNLWISIPALHLSFAVWAVWSILVVKLPDIGFKFTKDQLFWLAALPGLSGATLRLFYSFLVPVFGGRNWTVLSTASLLIPALGIGYAVQRPETSYSTFVLLSLLSGFGGGNFASSMSNISFFFPKAKKGTALGLNAGLGNLGVSVMQFAVPAVIGAGVFGALAGGPQVAAKAGGGAGSLWLQNAGFLWVPFIVITCIAAFMGMNNLASAKASFAEQSVIFRRKHNWVMSWIYTGTFGSFIGYAASFALLVKSLFPGINPAQFAFWGPLIGAAIRPVGGWLSDKIGGARVTFWNFLLMMVAVGGVLVFVGPVTKPAKELATAKAGLETLKAKTPTVTATELSSKEREVKALEASVATVARQQFPGFFAMFLLLFFTTGVGNGSTFRMVPVIFMTQHERMAAADSAYTREMSLKNAAKESAAVLGFTSAIGAYGMFLIPKFFGWSISSFGGPQVAFGIFLAFYAACVALTWWYYSRRGAEYPC